MKIYGYVREEKGNFENRKKRVGDFSKILDFFLEEIICEESGSEYEEMKKIQNLLKNEKDFILIVSDSSDLFESEKAKVLICEQLEENNVFLIDSYYPNFDYSMLLEKNSKEYPLNFLFNGLISKMENYLRMKDMGSSEDACYSDMRKRLDMWTTSLSNFQTD